VATFDSTHVAIKSVGSYLYIAVAPKPEEAKYLLRTALVKLDLVSLPSQPPAGFWVEVKNPSLDGANIFNNARLDYKDVPAHFAFGENLKKGKDCDDVKYLQIILNSDSDTRVAESGSGSPGHETSYFGDLTEKAVIKFQKKYGIISSEADAGAGYVGPKTRAKLNELLGIRKHVPDGWVLYATNTYQDKEIHDGYIWWEVKDVTDGTKGWAASEYLRYEEGKQEEWKEKTKKVVFLRDVPSNFAFNRNLSVGTEGDDVVYLQVILNSDPSTRLAESGPSSPGHETTSFDELTKTAVIKFQEKYEDEILKPLGLEHGTGYVGLTTRAKLNQTLEDKDLKARLEDEYELRKGRISVTREAVEQFLGKEGFPPSDFPVELILAMVAQESSFNNEVNEDGLLQVTAGSGRHRDGLYSNTRQGIYANVEDGLKVLKSFYDYSNNDTIWAIWRYNGGYDPYATYEKGEGDPCYLKHVADKYVEYGFGDRGSRWHELLMEAQKQVEVRSGTSCNSGYEQTQDSVDADWYDSLVWLNDNTPEPVPDYPETAYTVMSWWDYGDWIIRVAHRTPIAKPSEQGAREASKFFTSQNEISANQIMDELGAEYVMIDYPMPVLKFYAMVTWAGENESDFYDVYYAPTGNGTLQPVRLFYPSYYNSTVVRLYNFNGEAVVPAENATIVISYRDQVDRQGMWYKEITGSWSFSTYEEARDFISSHTSENYRIVGVDSFKSPVALEKLEHYQLIYATSSPHPVKIFEYTG